MGIKILYHLQTNDYDSKEKYTRIIIHIILEYRGITIIVWKDDELRLAYAQEQKSREDNLCHLLTLYFTQIVKKINYMSEWHHIVLAM